MNNGKDKSILGEFLSQAAKALVENVPAKDFKLFIIKNATGWRQTNFATAYWSFLNKNDIITYVPKTKTWKIGTRFAEALADMKTLKDIKANAKTPAKRDLKEHQAPDFSDYYEDESDFETSAPDFHKTVRTAKANPVLSQDGYKKAISIPASDADIVPITTENPAETLTKVQLMQEALTAAIAEKGIESVTDMLNILSK